MAVGTAANSDTFKVTTPSDREIVLTRLFDAPKHLVFEAMSKPEHSKQWWQLGPATRCRCAKSIRVGGAWRPPIARQRRPGHLLRRLSRGRAAGAVVFTMLRAVSDGESVVTAVLTEEQGKTRA